MFEEQCEKANALADGNFRVNIPTTMSANSFQGKYEALCRIYLDMLLQHRPQELVTKLFPDDAGNVLDAYANLAWEALKLKQDTEGLDLVDLMKTVKSGG